MTDDTTPEQLREQIREVEAEIADVQASTDELRTRSTDVEDAEDIAAHLTNVEEQEAVLGILRRRREAVLSQLQGLGDST